MKKGLLIALGVAVTGGAVYYFTQPSVEEKRVFLQNLDGAPRLAPFNVMSDQEIKDSYEVVKSYMLKNKQVPEGALKQRVLLISSKYNIFN